MTHSKSPTPAVPRCTSRRILCAGDVHDGTSIFGPDRCGGEAIALAVTDCLLSPGRVAVLSLGQHPKDGGAVKRWFRFGVGVVDGVPCLRWCGEGGNPNGAGSSSVVASWNPDPLQPARLATKVAWNVAAAMDAEARWVFRWYPEEIALEPEPNEWPPTADYEDPS